MANALMSAPSATNTMANNGSGAFDWSRFMPGAAGIAQGIMGNSGAPYDAASSAYNDVINQYLPKMQNNMAPYMQGGQIGMNNAFGAYGNASNALSRMANPQEFLNNILSGYQESPAAAMERKYGMQGMGNAASASGMLGSGALMKSAADYNQQLTSRDMQQYLDNVLGINRDYLSGQMGLGQGYGGMAHMGLSAGTSLNDILARMGLSHAEMAGGAAYGEKAGEQQDTGSFINGIGKLLPFLF